MANYNTIIFISRIVRALLKDTLQTDGKQSYTYQGIAVFTLPDDFPSSTTIAVYKNGTLLSTGWSYNSTNNTVTITASLTTNDTILITYHYYDKYSENEILSYTEASLAIFAQHNYSKIFRLNSDRNEVHTINGINPTVAECYQICIVTAINIDPKNIDIRTKEFSISAEEHKSKSELISEAFQKFTGSFLGKFEWVEILQEEI